MKKIELKTDVKKLRTLNERYVSYNVEMAEVTGGTFWKTYPKDVIAGTEEFKLNAQTQSLNDMFGDLMQYYRPIDLYNEKLRKLAKNLGRVWVRVSGTWATKTYYDFDGTTNGKVPDGYLNILTKEQWLGVLDFVKAVDGKLLISVANCPGVHKADEPWHSGEAENLLVEQGIRRADRRRICKRAELHHAGNGLPRRLYRRTLPQRSRFVFCLAEKELSGMYLRGTERDGRRRDHRREVGRDREVSEKSL